MKLSFTVGADNGKESKVPFSVKSVTVEAASGFIDVTQLPSDSPNGVNYDEYF